MDARRYPASTAAGLARDQRTWSATRRVGRYTGVALEENDFDSFLLEVRKAAISATGSPFRLLTLSHLANATALAIPELPNRSRPLVEGFILELIARSQLTRTMTVSRQLTPYQTITSFPAGLTLGDTVNGLWKALRASGCLSVAAAEAILPAELTVRAANVPILLGHLIYLGVATTDDQPGSALGSIRLPDA